MPTTHPQPKPTTLYDWLTKAFERGLVRIEGTGHRDEPYEYYLPEKMEEWKKNPMFELERQSRQAFTDLFKKMGMAS
jgi:DNA-binding PadR family transcriptional regulator